MQNTLLTSCQNTGDFTSALTTRGRGYVHAMFRVGSAISNPTLSIMSLTAVLQAKIPGSDDLWCDIQTWAIVGTESMPGRDLSYLVSEPGVDVKLGVKLGNTGFFQAKLWEG